MKNQTKLFVTIMLSVIYSISFSQDCSNLFISEYIEGTGNNKALEIYNPTNEIIDLSRYYVARFSNGGLTYESGGITQLQGFIQARSTHVLVNGQKTSTETSPACSPDLQAMATQLDNDYPAPTYMNGNDAIALYYDSKGNGNNADFSPIDLFGIIGGGMSSDDEGWAAFTDKWIYKNIYEGDVVVGKDSIKIKNYIVPEGYYWIPWSSNHSLVRKPEVLSGVTENPTTEFIVTTEWDTLTGGANVWDSLGTHFCNCDKTSSVKNTKDVKFTIFPNPANDILSIYSENAVKNVRIFSQDGKLVHELSILDKEEYQTNIDVNDLSQGVYFINISTAQGIYTEKVIVE
jgi:hypothetical protein